MVWPNGFLAVRHVLVNHQWGSDSGVGPQFDRRIEKRAFGVVFTVYGLGPVLADALGLLFASDLGRQYW